MTDGGVIHNIVVVDTNVISFLFKGDTRVDLYAPYLDGKLQMLAAQTRAELERWMLLRDWGKRRCAALREYLKAFVFVSADEAICLQWAKIQDQARRAGRPVSCADAWIAATALAFEVPLVIHNPDDFRHIPELIILTEK